MTVNETLHNKREISFKNLKIAILSNYSEMYFTNIFVEREKNQKMLKHKQVTILIFWNLQFKIFSLKKNNSPCLVLKKAWLTCALVTSGVRKMSWILHNLFFRTLKSRCIKYLNSTFPTQVEKLLYREIYLLYWIPYRMQGKKITWYYFDNSNIWYKMQFHSSIFDYNHKWIKWLKERKKNPFQFR